MRVSLVHHGIGNVVSVLSALEQLGADVEIADTPEKVLSAERLVLPGVGAAGPFLESLRARGFAEALEQRVRRQAHPFLGICMGMQAMARRLREHGDHEGLGWIADDVVSLADLVPEAQRIPHMGWNEIALRDDAPEPLQALRRDRCFYFCHSFAYARAAAPYVAATTDYGHPVVAAVISGTALGAQFHPERSQLAGDKFLSAFLDWSP